MNASMSFGETAAKEAFEEAGVTAAKEAFEEAGVTAAKEAFEEAGVIGRVSPNSVGMFRAKKPTPVPKIVEVWVYLLEVDEMLDKWPEKDKRQIRWASCKAAARELRNPILTDLCHHLAQG